MLSTRALGRALLARQHLLDRTAMAPEAMIGHLVGLQAQAAPEPPYFGLWSLDRPTRAELAQEGERLLAFTCGGAHRPRRR
ncbi:MULTISPECIES: hypothetical protein [Kitasatospora]|uniref:Winged helix DNA-binding domain-containing protein n=1 Tax=Kitasatospora cystarginea TaxID=58350 RepID=A0ABN3EX81_9ACTN